MRPRVLYPLFAPVRSLAGVGPKLAPLLVKVAGKHVVDLLWHLPTGLVDRRYAPAIAEAEPGRVATLTVRVDAHQPPSRTRSPYKILCSDVTGTLVLVYFNARQDYLTGLLPPGAERVVSGVVELRDHERQMTHPDHVVAPDRVDDILGVEPVYPLTAGLSPKVLGRQVRGALERAPELPEWQDAAWLERQGWRSWHASLMATHAPENPADLLPSSPTRARLAYDELLANQLALTLIRRRMRQLPGRTLAGDGALRKTILASLPFTLTESQERAVAEITREMSESRRMLRLLQGDVGSGKTVVALLAMLAAVEAGTQAALMAPTEILARQHFATIAPLVAASGLDVQVLTGRDKGKAREALLGRLADGSLPLVIGTHSLFQDDVAFHDLGLAVIDEQHRFGVHQRLGLAGKGGAVDVLVMTATPIPRTLMLTAYGDMEDSRLTEKPPGRRSVDTRTVSQDRLHEVVSAVGRALEAGNRIYWICPLVDESEVTDMAAAEARFRELERVFGAKVGLVHGRMKSADKDRAMAAFKEGSIGLLVATTVIEVGVDVPEATVMVIEHAERFGLAQLHQLRGRVGRGERPSTCLLVYAPPLTGTARARLAVLRETDDGFRIAEEDLTLRGAGDLLGTKQSGLPMFRLADLEAHGDLLPIARDDARLILERSPELEGPRGEALRMLLYLFERDAAVRLLRSG